MSETRDACEHPKLYALDFANQPKRLDGCMFCERDALRQRVEVADALRRGLKPEHRCEPIARALMQDGRDWWIGKLTEPVAEHPQETHCLHLRTPLKDVVLLINGADCEWLTVLCRAARGPLSETWLDRVTQGAKARAPKEPA